MASKLFSFFNSRSSREDFSFLGVDMHSHLIYGIDDGSRTKEETLELISSLHDMGFKKLITTPHTYLDYFPNTTESINAGLQKVIVDCNLSGLRNNLQAASEYYGDEHLLKLLGQEEHLLTIGGSCVLFEVSMLAQSPLLDSIVFELITKDYQPILAHPERYFYMKGDKYKELKSSGCALQVNLLSLAGYYGKEQKKLGIRLIEEGLVDFLGTDIHHAPQLKFLEDLSRDRKVMNLLKTTPFKNKSLL